MRPVVNARGRTISVNTTGEFKSPDDLRNVIIGASPNGTPLYLRDLVDIDRGYDSPPSYLNTFTRRDENGKWITTRAITLSIQMRKGEQIGVFGKLVDANLQNVRKSLPGDLVLARTSDQPLQVHDSIELFSHSLIEAVVLVVIVALIGFWSWRTAILMAASMPITLAITFGVINTLGHRPATGLHRFADYRPGASGGRAGRVGRRHCARTGRGRAESPSQRGLGQPSCLRRWHSRPSPTSSHICRFCCCRGYRQVSVQPANRD